MTTTTFTAIVAKAAERIAGLTPLASPPTTGFVRHATSHKPLRDWVPEAGQNLTFRVFEVGRGDGEWAPPGINAHDAKLIGVPFLCTVCYPVNPKLLGLGTLYDLEAVIESDADQISDALQKTTALVAGMQGHIDVAVGRLERTERFWFQPITSTAVFYAAKH